MLHYFCTIRCGACYIAFFSQEYLRLLVINNIENYAKLIEGPCIVTKGVNADFRWGSDLYTSQFEGNTPPLFCILLTMNAKGSFYSPVPDDYEVG